MERQVELLAPVGGKEALYAAVQNGANAVYLGGKLFNARHSATNFDSSELKEAIRYAHLHKVKVYVTVNILIDDKEMRETLDYIRFLYEIDVDAIIVQDLGLASLVRELFPKLDLHASTQMTINNLDGAKQLEELGFSRIVLARETPLEEIKRIKAGTTMELESFVHGALCVSYSGQCLMSSMIGGRSGNRGRCAQPCRMKYSIVDNMGRLVQDWDKKHVISPRDLNTLEHLDRLIESGITSLKIEGRMKRPEYVATIVANYRKALDFGVEAITEGDKKDVTQIFNREFTKGLGLGDFGRTYISYDRPDNRGSLLGYVSRVDKYRVYIMLQDDVEKGDGIELTLKNGDFKGFKVPINLSKGNVLVFEKSGFIEKGSPVYKTSSESLLARAKSSYQDKKIRYPLDMRIDIKIGEKPRLELKYEDYRVEETLDFLVEKGENISLDEKSIKKQLSKLGNTNYYLNKLEISLESGSFLPMAVLNRLRREAIESLNQTVANFNKRKSLSDADFEGKIQSLLEYTKRQSYLPIPKLNIRVSTRSQYEQLDKDKLDRVYLGFYEDVEEIIQELKSKGKEVYLWTERILYKEELEELDKIIRPIEDKIDGISVSNLGTLHHMRNRYRLNLHGDIGLNVFNSYTARYLKSLGLRGQTLSPELTLEQIKGITGKVGSSMEAIVYGYLPLMVMKTCPMALVKGCKDDRDCASCNFARGYGLRDRMDMTFYMERKGINTTIFNAVPIMVLDSLKSIARSGLSSFRLDFTIEKDNIRQIQAVYYDYIHSRIDEDEAVTFVEDFKKHTNITKGHYYRGIL